MKRSQKTCKLENGRIVSKTQFYRLKKKAEELGCRLCDVPDTRGRHKNHSRGKNHYRYTLKLITSHGYELIRLPKSHPLHVANGYGYMHRYVYSKKIGRWVKPHELVHHEDRNKLNNHPSNLKKMPRSNHNKLHIDNGDVARDIATGRFRKKLS